VQDLRVALFRYDPAIIEAFPAVVGGVIHASGVTNGVTPSALAAAFRDEHAAVRGRLADRPLSELPTLAAWRRVFRRLRRRRKGAPAEYRVSAGQATRVRFVQGSLRNAPSGVRFGGNAPTRADGSLSMAHHEERAGSRDDRQKEELMGHRRPMPAAVLSIAITLPVLCGSVAAQDASVPPSAPSDALVVPIRGTLEGMGGGMSREEPFPHWYGEFRLDDGRLAGCVELRPSGRTPAGTWGTIVIREATCDLPPDDRHAWEGAWFAPGARVLDDGSGHPDFESVLPLDPIWLEGHRDNAGLSAVLRVSSPDGALPRYAPAEGWIFPTPEGPDDPRSRWPGTEHYGLGALREALPGDDTDSLARSHTPGPPTTLHQSRPDGVAVAHGRGQDDPQADDIAERTAPRGVRGPRCGSSWRTRRWRPCQG
jgi:hypothetical protein